MLPEHAKTLSNQTHLDIMTKTLKCIFLHYMKNIYTRLVTALLAASTLTACQTTDIREIPVKIAGGETVKVKAGPRGPKPAEDARIKITGAAIIISPPDEIGDTPSLVWSFSLDAKTQDAITRITVENVLPVDPAAVLIDDHAPHLNDGMWINHWNNGDPMGKQNGWLQQKGLAPFVFRFTIHFKDGTQSVLHQLATFGDNDKRFFLNAARQAGERYIIQGGK